MQVPFTNHIRGHIGTYNQGREGGREELWDGVFLIACF